jgi:hypothetical protein
MSTARSTRSSTSRACSRPFRTSRRALYERSRESLGIPGLLLLRPSDGTRFATEVELGAEAAEPGRNAKNFTVVGTIPDTARFRAKAA